MHDENESVAEERIDYRILDAEFERSAATCSDLPAHNLGEVVFVGRSNVGKSSLINALCRRKGLAFTSKRPGRTQLFNYYKVRCRKQPANTENWSDFNGYLVDVPGYGYAKAPKREQLRWQRELENYLLERQSLSAVFLLIDCRRDPGEEEQWISELGAAGGLTVVLTKIDKLNKQELARRRASIESALAVAPQEIVATSSGGKPQGISALARIVCRSLDG